MIAASTAAALRPNASPAALPSITRSTRSPTPAPTESIASTVAPLASPSSVVGCTSISLAPSSLRFFWVETTVPTTLPICIPVVHDADDGGVGRRLGGIERKHGFASADEEDVFADAGADRIERDQRAAGCLAGGGDGLQNEECSTDEVGVFDAGDHLADHAGELHILYRRGPLHPAWRPSLALAPFRPLISPL